MEILGRQIELVIFDLDGTLLDSTSIWGEIDEAFFARRCQQLPPTYAQEIAHIGLVAAASYTKTKYFPQEKEEDILNEWQDLSIQAYRETIPLKEGSKELLDALKDKGIPLAVATANSELLYGPALQRLGIQDYFDFIVDADLCPSGKSSPAMYDQAVEHFGTTRDKTLVIEDSLEPLKVAFDAGFLVIGVYDKQSSKAGANHDKYCHKYVQNPAEVAEMID